jgi:large subunit ribosomal protein L6
MSRIGKLPITVPDNIKVVIDNNKISISNEKSKKIYQFNKGINVEFKNKEIKLTALDKNSDEISMIIGMDRSNIKNIINGLQSPYKITLEINGVGYKASVEKNLLYLTLGYSHEICYSLPVGINATFEKPNLINIIGDDKILVGQVASEIINYRKPEPYKGKGIKVLGKQILRKEGKKK